MAKITFNTLYLSDLIVHEEEPFVAYHRSEVSVTLTSGQTLTLGAPLYRAKAATPGNWAPVTANTQLVTTNEFALYIANTLGEVLPLTAPANGNYLAAAIVRGPIIVKDATVKAAATALGLTVADDQTNLLHLLKAQGIIAEKVIAG